TRDTAIPVEVAGEDLEGTGEIAALKEVAGEVGHAVGGIAVESQEDEIHVQGGEQRPSSCVRVGIVPEAAHGVAGHIETGEGQVAAIDVDILAEDNLDGVDVDPGKHA